MAATTVARGEAVNCGDGQCPLVLGSGSQAGTGEGTATETQSKKPCSKSNILGYDLDFHKNFPK